MPRAHSDPSPAIPASNVPENARFCPVPPDTSSNRRNEPTARATMPENARLRPVLPDQSLNRWNEPKAGEDGVGADLTPRQLQAINLLFAGQNFKTVCGQLAIDDKTLYRWRQSEAFAAEVRRRYRENRVSRRPPSRRVAIIAAPSDGSEVHAAGPVGWDELSEAIRHGDVVPPPLADEPLWIREIRASRARRDAADEST
jgi:hypothetical protein